MGTVAAVAVVCMAMKTAILRYSIYRIRKGLLRDAEEFYDRDKKSYYGGDGDDDFEYGFDIIECLELVGIVFRLFDSLALLALVVLG